jgi:hypothetical protein
MEDKMTVEDEGYLGKWVELIEDLPGIEKGRRGLCTADLEGHDVFQVWFDNPLSVTVEEDGTVKPFHWMRFKWTMRDKFLIVGDRMEELKKAFAPVMKKIEDGKK